MTKDEILSMAEETGFAYMPFEQVLLDRLERFAALVAEKERKECVKVLHDNATKSKGMAVHALIASAQQIEARGHNEYRGARLVLTKDGVIQDGWMGDK
jgi:HPt (histidine-containing phosphotransfer) domain-containing protein